MPEFSDIKEYWEWAHETADTLYLTGTSLDGHLWALGANDLLKPHCNILCIGIGNGNWIHELADRLAGTGSITAIDISGAARARVAKIASALSPETFYRIQPRNCFDLAMSLWVSPHMTTGMVAAQLEAVVPSLTTQGVFAIHYNEPIAGCAFDEAQFIAGYRTEADALSTGLLRMTRAKFLEIVDGADGQVLGWPFRQEAPDYDEVIFAAHVTRSRAFTR